MAVWVLGHPRVLHPMGAGLDAFLHLWLRPEPDPRKTEFGCRFHFFTRRCTQNSKPKKPWKNSKPEKILKETHLQNLTGDPNLTCEDSITKINLIFYKMAAKYRQK
jgi:hypothetical protein